MLIIADIKNRDFLGSRLDRDLVAFVLFFKALRSIIDCMEYYGRSRRLPPVVSNFFLQVPIITYGNSNTVYVQHRRIVSLAKNCKHVRQSLRLAPRAAPRGAPLAHCLPPSSAHCLRGLRAFHVFLAQGRFLVFFNGLVESHFLVSTHRKHRLPSHRLTITQFNTEYSANMMSFGICRTHGQP